ncbi:putative fructoselysine utilization operon transcriptional repressor [Streptomyces sp. RB5]|uniref:Putative fructoselysine utilization operon transcriptional repressor n=1 Tax=Streptomyces smaragdinus TaxID=2585196 RepID=A0A7K0CM75_9ACTN|nr:GntR family transcriptional regulator [Streptomyces smaragdinus]MQY14588.1 putative fructoselysine utilization operon transcriptional repressor [Streptomyces smaragdinus]
MGDTRPVYQRIADELRDRIDSGELKVGAQIPSRSELKRAYAASDQTVDRAVRVLKAAGYAQGQFGRGVFVTDRTPLGTLLRDTGTVDTPFAARISTPDTAVAWEATSVTTPAPRHVAERLGIAAGDRVMCTRYEYLADRRPVQLATSWEPLARTEGTDVVFPERGPYARRGVRGRMAAIGIRVVRAAEIVGSRAATSAEAEALGCAPGQCLTVVERTHYDADDRPVETSDVVVRADRWRLEYSIDFTG